MNKELEALKRIEKMYKYFVKNSRDLEPKLMICEKEDFATIETKLKEKAKLEIYTGILKQVLRIIKDKLIDTDWLFQFYRQDISYEKYLTIINEEEDKLAQRFMLTKSEYELLKVFLWKI